jgi:anti-anti-sigma factor
VGDIELREAVRGALDGGQKNLVLKLAGVTVMDSAGIGELVSSYTATAQRGGKLKLIGLTPKVLDLLHITQLITIFETFDDEKEAVASF